MRSRFALAVVGIGAAALAIASCRDPTEVTLEITTDVPCGAVLANGGGTIRVGSPANVEGDLAQQVEARTCVNGRVGSLVVVPSDSVDDQVAIFVAAGVTSQTAASSRQNPKGCILARRVLRYVPHTPLTLPIDLAASCIDKPCSPGETCNKGQCRSDTVACTGGVCEVPPDRPDAGVPDAACASPQASCGGACVDLTTNPSHCGACNFVCNGECQAGICRLVPSTGKSGMPDEPLGTTGCLAVAGTPPEVFWTAQRTQAGTSAVYAIDRGGGAATVIGGSIVDLGGISAGRGRVVYGATTSGLAVVRSLPTGTHTPPTVLGSSISAGHVTAVALSSTTDQACWTTAGDHALRCTGWATGVSVDLLSPNVGEFVAIGATVAAVGGLPFEAVFSDLTTPLRSPTASTGVRGVTAMVGADVFYATKGAAMVQFQVKQPAPLTIIETPMNPLASPGLGIAFDPTTNPQGVYWVEDDGNGDTSIHTRTLQSSVVTTRVTNQKGAYCIVVDDQAVYWLSNGIPHKMPK